MTPPDDPPTKIPSGRLLRSIEDLRETLEQTNDRLERLEYAIQPDEDSKDKTCIGCLWCSNPDMLHIPQENGDAYYCRECGGSIYPEKDQ